MKKKTSVKMCLYIIIFLTSLLIPGLLKNLKAYIQEKMAVKMKIT